MASIINIGRCHVDDPFYRYKMPPVTIKQESRGNGCKTLLTNIDSIAVALARTPEALSRFISKRLATQAKYSKSVSTLRGHFERQTVQDVVEDFIDRNVLCGKCTNPETTVEVKKKSTHLLCKACGHITDLSKLS